MNIQQTAEKIVKALENTMDPEKYNEVTEAVIWDELRSFFNTAYLMRKYQKAYFTRRDTLNLRAAKKYEGNFDKIIAFLETQKSNSNNKTNKLPSLWTDTNT